MADISPIETLMIGTGEYTTGFVAGSQSTSDKKVGVVALTLFDLRRRGKVGKLGMVGTTGSKFDAIRGHFKAKISDVYNGLDCSFDGYPKGDQRDPDAYKKAIDELPAGSAITIFTPDSTHYPIALYAIQRKIHVLLTKPATQLLEHHKELIKAARDHGVVVMVEHHKRFDPAYNDARARAQNLGEFGFFSSYMSQPKTQLDTFKAWAGKDSDISYYLNSHHIDVHSWIVAGKSIPTRVTASGASGVATGEPYGCVAGTEDTITLLVDWKSTSSDKHSGTAVYTASWTAPLGAGVHSEQRFHYMAAKGEVRVDQARRGYDVVVDGTGIQSINPFYMKYSPDEDGNLDSSRSYGYISIEKFIDAARAVNSGKITLEQLDAKNLPTIKNTVITTAILEAGRRSLDTGRTVEIVQDANGDLSLK